MKVSKVILDQDGLRARRIGFSDVGALKLDYADILEWEVSTGNSHPANELLLRLYDGRDIRLVLSQGQDAARLAEEISEILEPRVIQEDRAMDMDRIPDICRELLASRGANIRKTAEFLISQGLAHNAGDIALDPAESGGLLVRFKIDGRLFPVAEFDRETGRRLIGSLKAASGMVLYREDIIQEGRLTRRTEGGEQDLRVSVMPSDGGERVSIRTFDKLKGSSLLRDLGFGCKHLEMLKRVCSSPQGLFIICGPSSSGKTTTLYAMLRYIREIRGDHSGIITLEDPVEYRLSGVTQVQMEPGVRLEFADTLKSCLRQDPGVIMVGEIRDGDTADAVIQAALTGHLVLTTVHCGSAAEAITRLLDLNVRPFLLRSVLHGVICQRLVRMTCPDCGADVPPGEEDKGVWPDGGAPASVFVGTGCRVCRHSGYRGRTVVAEFLHVTDRIGDLISGASDTGGIARAAVDEGMHTLKDAGRKMIKDRITDPKEIKRVLG